MKTPDSNATPSDQARTPRDIADRTELAVFAGFLDQYVETAGAREELALATVSVARLAEQLDLDAVSVVEAVELITGSLLQKTDQLSRGRAARYSEAMTVLIRSLVRNA